MSACCLFNVLEEWLFTGIPVTWCEPRFVTISLVRDHMSSVHNHMIFIEFVPGSLFCLIGTVINMFFPLTFYLGIDYLTRCLKLWCCHSDGDECIQWKHIYDEDTSNDCFKTCFPITLVWLPYTILFDVTFVPLIRIANCLRMCTYVCFCIGGCISGCVGASINSVALTLRRVAISNRVEPDANEEDSSDASTVLGDDAIVLGDDAIVLGDDAIVLGDDAIVPGDDAIVLGDDAIVPGN